ncbi:hypothetical protein ASC65_16010 [Brevundimonas sp. Root1279]|nr:hypothetical protein ASC65_16010 [Brevundimonas sp. Root1279]
MLINESDLIGSAVDIFTIIFGGKYALVDMFRRKIGTSPLEVQRLVADNPGFSATQISVGASALRDGNITHAIEALMSAAITKGVSRVEIQIRDEPPVTIYEAKDRQDARLLATSNLEMLDPLVDLAPLELTRVGDEILGTRSDDGGTHLFLATRYPMPPPHENLLVLWPAASPLPEPGESFVVKARRMSQSEIAKLPLGGTVPPAFEDALAVLKVGTVFR